MLCGSGTTWQPMRTVNTSNAHDAKNSFAPLNSIHATIHLTNLRCVVSNKNHQKLPYSSSGFEPAWEGRERGVSGYEITVVVFAWEEGNCNG